MAGAKETPRQKMIGMMYLVLTALLALNVSADLLNAFVIVNEAMDKTNVNFKDKNNFLYTDFEAQYKNKPDKVQKWWDKAQEVRKLSAALVKQIHDVQNQVIGYTEYGKKEIKGEVKYIAINPNGKEEEKTASEPRLVPLSSLTTRDNFDKPMEVLLGLGDAGTSGEASKIKKAIESYREKIAEIMDSVPANRPDRIKKMGFNLDKRWNPNAGEEQIWELSNFAHNPMAADIILLNKLIADVQNVEAESIKNLMENITKTDYKFDNLKAAVIPTNGTVLVTGQPFEADIFIAANSSTDKPDVYVGSQKITTIEEGVAKYKVGTGGVGEQKFAGVIKVTKDDGTSTDYPFNGSYMVIKPTATFSADAMNVVYKGLENPLSVSAPGFTNDKITVNVSPAASGTLKSLGNGKYQYIPSAANGEVSFSVVGKSGDGKVTNLGAFPYRIRPVPSPTTRLAGAADGGTLDRALLSVRGEVTCILENFLMNVPPYMVNSFDLQVINPKKPPLYETVQGGKLSEALITKIKTFPVGSKITVSNVKVTGKSGAGRGTTISITLN